MKKKPNSIWTEPYYLVQMLWEAVRLVAASVRSVISGASRAAKEDAITNKEANESYLRMREELKTEETKQAWRRFLVTGLIIQTFLIVITLLHGVLGNYFIFLELLVLLVGSFVLFGYKPWILRNKLVISFPQYLKSIFKDPGSLLLWNSLNILD